MVVCASRCSVDFPHLRIQVHLIKTATEQNLALCCERVLPRDWLASFNDSLLTRPWMDALVLLASAVLAPPLSSCCCSDTSCCLVLGGLGWHAVRLQAALMRMASGRIATPVVVSQHLDRLSWAMALSVIGANCSSLGVCRSSFVVGVNESASQLEVSEAALLEQVVRKALVGLHVISEGVVKSSNGDTDSLPKTESGCEQRVALLVCVNVCTSRLSLRQLASQLRGERRKLMPHAIICPAVVKIRAALVESQALVSLNEVCV